MMIVLILVGIKRNDNMYIQKIIQNCITGRIFKTMDKDIDYIKCKQHDYMWYESWGKDNKIRLSSYTIGIQEKVNRHSKCKKYNFKKSNNGKEHYY